jgi:antitoxin component YwqK of YwqJK toxin-antitoxin module
MMRKTKWISSVTVGLLWTLAGSPAMSQQLPRHGEPTLAQAPVDAPETEAGTNSESDGYRPYTADPDGASSEDGAGGDGLTAEVIKERFADGSVKIEREVTQDAEGNYLNHGSWKLWDERGNLLAQGQYHFGERAGTWVRWYRNPAEAPVLKFPPYNEFTGPFISQATFDNGKLNGYWTIYDGKVKKISQWRFADGRRHGLSTWWHANGRKMREINFRDGNIDGTLIEWSPEGAVELKETYQDGRKLAQKTSHYGDSRKKSQGMYLFAKDTEKTPDDWWNCKLVQTVKSGNDEKHGPWVSWHSNGKPQLQGAYEHDVQVGPFTWWHDNGQKALAGRYENGKQDGPWTWWYPSGQKSIHGQYVNGNPTGRWTWWKEDGKVAQSADLSHSEGVVIDEPPQQLDKPNVLPHVRQTNPRQPVRR